MTRNRRVLLAGALLACITSSAAPVLHSTVDRALQNISQNSLRANLSFLSSDALQGRWTPSPGLDIAAEFIASRFRAAAIEPGNHGSYFQEAELAAKPPIHARNVIAILPGADPKLRNTYLILSAHYDHIGTLATAGPYTRQKTPIDGDTIFNGANDDGSGTVSVIEIATALKRAHYHPKRTIVFLLFCGEEIGERGELGSKYYIRHPLYPLKQTIADVNLEQVGRSDSDFGKGNASTTGYGYTTMTPLFEQAAKASGFHLIKTETTDRYFEASDNYSFALAGIPDVTFSTAFVYPDYHGLKDEWTKIDFPDLARADRLVTRVLCKLADNVQTPQWNASNPKAEKFRQAESARRTADEEPK